MISNVLVSLTGAAPGSDKPSPVPFIACPNQPLVSDLHKTSADAIISRNPLVREHGEVSRLQDFLWQYRGQFTGYPWGHLNRLENKSDFVTGYYGDLTAMIVRGFNDKYNEYIVPSDANKVIASTRQVIARQCSSIPPPPPVTSSCPGPYHGLASDGRCVWSCGVGTTPNAITNECVCNAGFTQVGIESSGRRFCFLDAIPPVVTFVLPVGNNMSTTTARSFLPTIAVGITDNRGIATSTARWTNTTTNTSGILRPTPYGWLSGRISLVPGNNTITASVQDMAGNIGTNQFTAIYRTASSTASSTASIASPVLGEVLSGLHDILSQLKNLFN